MNVDRSLKCLAAAILCGVCACDSGLQSGRGLRLPDGDLARGEQAFEELGCRECHGVVGGPDARPDSGQHPPLILGGEVTRVASYGQLITSIINPSHDISSRFPPEDTREGAGSRMHDVNEKMTVEQLIDLSAFLRSRYERRPAPEYTR